MHKGWRCRMMPSKSFDSKLHLIEKSIDYPFTKSMVA